MRMPIMCLRIMEMAALAFLSLLMLWLGCVTAIPMSSVIGESGGTGNLETDGGPSSKNQRTHC